MPIKTIRLDLNDKGTGRKMEVFRTEKTDYSQVADKVEDLTIISPIDDCKISNNKSRFLSSQLAKKIIYFRVNLF